MNIPESGEINPLDAERLEDQARLAARETVDESELGYGDERDSAAIIHMVERLRAAEASRGKSREAIQEQAETLYAHICRQIASGQVSQVQLATMADLVGESSLALQARLQVED